MLAEEVGDEAVEGAVGGEEEDSLDATGEEVGADEIGSEGVGKRKKAEREE